MANAILLKTDAEDLLTITLNSLADGVGRSSAVETNSNNRPGATITVKLTSGSTPTAGDVVEVYLLRDTGTEATDDWPGTNATFTPENAWNLGSIVFTATATKEFIKEFDTSIVPGPLGPAWGICIVNNSGAALHTSGNAIRFYYWYPEVQ